MIEITIGEVTKSCCATKVFGIENHAKGGISQNRHDYWVSGVTIADVYVKISKDHTVDKKISDMIKTSNAPTLYKFIERQTVKRMNPSTVMSIIDLAYDEGVREGRAQKLNEILKP